MLKRALIQKIIRICKHHDFTSCKCKQPCFLLSGIFLLIYIMTVFIDVITTRTDTHISKHKFKFNTL